ncbi:hypothetical protein JXB27_00030 [Candidatus Woesearchaeota archaeon]|nr:hypothetical protein [Candidatus Woesearchaeota archaeon]
MRLCNYCQKQLQNSENSLCDNCYKLLQFKLEKAARPYWDAGVSYNSNININYWKNGFFREKELNAEEIYDFMYDNFIRFKAVGIKGGRETAYLLMPRFNESLIHFFLCKSIEEYIKGFTGDVRLYTTKKPDIVFGAGGRKFAVEVETGSGASHPKRLRAKVKQLRKEYEDRWFFVVSSYTLRGKYEKFGKTLVRGEVAGEIQKIFRENSKQPDYSLRQRNTA